MNDLERLLKRTISATSLASILLFSSLAEAQESEPDASEIYDVNPAARLGVLGVNALGNGLLCGVVGVANQRNFFQDAGKCMAAGTLQYLGMEMGMHNVPVLPGVGLRVVETGTSIIENTLAGREPFERLQYEIGPSLFQIDLKEKNVNFYWRIAPIIGSIHNVALGNEVNWFDTFSYQTLVFNADVNLSAENRLMGLTTGNVMFYDPKYPDIAAHEFNHVLQYVRFRPAQLVVPEQLSFLEDTLHYRLGEDAALLFFYGINMSGCAARDNDPLCDKHWWNLLEAESYIMQTAHEEYEPESVYWKNKK